MHRVAFSVDDIDVALEIAARHGCHTRCAENTGLVAAELEISELPGTSATARADLG